jgi:hypothetical protein
MNCRIPQIPPRGHIFTSDFLFSHFSENSLSAFVSQSPSKTRDLRSLKMLSQTLLPLLLLRLTVNALPVVKPDLDQRAAQDYSSSIFRDTPLTPKYDPSKYGNQDSGSDSSDDSGNTNVASSFSPSIQGSPFANGNSLHLGRLLQFRKRQDITNVASSFAPSIQDSPFLNGNTIAIREAEGDLEERQDNTNVASSFSPSIQDSPFLNNNAINVAGEESSDKSDCKAGGSSGPDNTNVASSFSPSIQNSPFLNCNSVNVLSGKK